MLTYTQVLSLVEEYAMLNQTIGNTAERVSVNPVNVGLKDYLRLLESREVDLKDKIVKLIRQDDLHATLSEVWDVLTKYKDDDIEAATARNLLLRHMRHEE